MSQAGTYNAGSPAPGTVVESLTGDVGGPVGPDGAGNIDLLGTAGVIVTTGSPGTNTITWSLDDSIATQYDTDMGTAIPVGGVLNVLGAHGINTAGAGDTVTIAINNAITLGDLANITAGNNALLVETGDIEIEATNGVGNLNIPLTISGGDAGVIEVNSTPFLHNFGINNQNIFLGFNAGNFGAANNSFLNIGIGENTLSSINSGAGNTVVGHGAAPNITSSSGTVVIGQGSLGALTNGSANTVVGSNAMSQAINGQQCIAIGGNTLGGTLNGALRNIAIGGNAGSAYTSTERDNILLGIGSGVGVVGDTNTLRIGLSSGTGNGQLNRAFIAGIATVVVANTQMVTIDTVTNQLGSQAIPSGFADTFTTDSGNALPVSGVLNVLGGVGTTTSGAGNTITITSDNAGFNWQVVTVPQIGGDSQGYFTNDVGSVDVALPALSAVGDTFQVAAMSAGGWTISQGAGQSIRIGTQVTTTGVTGSLASTDMGDWVTLVCNIADTSWMAFVNQGNPNIV